MNTTDDAQLQLKIDALLSQASEKQLVAECEADPVLKAAILARGAQR